MRGENSGVGSEAWVVLVDKEERGRGREGEREGRREINWEKRR